MSAAAFEAPERRRKSNEIWRQHPGDGAAMQVTYHTDSMGCMW